jgi:hypothetical protein
LAAGPDQLQRMALRLDGSLEKSRLGAGRGEGI